MSGRIAILLATYNGEKYLDDQMGSLFAQTYSDFVVIVRDDCSNDRTPEILARWAASYPDKIKIVSDDRGNLRSIRNFGRLMEVCDTPYFAFCDQDDVWLPNKIELMINKIRSLEREFGNTTPIMVYSDLSVVDGELREVSSSLFRHRRIDINRAQQLDHLIVEEVCFGCALIGNRSLLELARPLPKEARSHDGWVALIAASCGVLWTIPKPTILYRQHDENQAGAGPRRGPILWDARYILQQPRKLTKRLADALAICQNQAYALLRVAGSKMPRRNRDYLRAFCLPQCRGDIAGLPWMQQAALFGRFPFVLARALPRALRWCF